MNTSQTIKAQPYSKLLTTLDPAIAEPCDRVTAVLGSDISVPSQLPLLDPDTETSTSNNQLFIPLHYSPNYAYPLVVWLHQTNGNERELLRIIPSLGLRNYAAVAPRGLYAESPCRSTENPASFPGSQSHACCWPVSRLHTIENRVFAAIEQIQSVVKVHHKRIYIAGVSNSGSVALALALRNPEVFAGAVSFDGGLPGISRLFGQYDLQVKQSYFIGVTEHPASYPIQSLDRDMKTFAAMGISAQYRKFSQDRFEPEMLEYVDRWIMRHIDTAIH